MSKLKLHDLLAALQQDIDRLEEGDLHLSELQAATDHARTLYERLLVLNYLAQERLVKGDREQTKMPFRLNAIHPGQTSLIDAIEEISKIDNKDEKPENRPKVEAKQEELEEPEAKAERTKSSSALKFGEPTPEQMPESKERPQAPPEAEEASKVKSQQSKEAPKAAKKSAAVSEEASLADKLRRSPVADLRKAISLNQKFQFIKSFFDGDAQSYDRLIDGVNGATDLNEALAKVQVHVPAIEEKAEEDEVAASLLDLVERRFL